MTIPGRVTGIDHIVVDAADPLVVVDWYVDVLGLEPERVEEFRRGEVFFPSVRIDATTIIDVFPSEPTGENYNHICLLLSDADIEAVAAHPSLDVIEGPVTRWGAQGDAQSVYVRDPVGNTVELRTYG